MSIRVKIYLAGPEVFLADASELGSRKKAHCAGFGFGGLFPFDNEISHIGTVAEGIDRSVYRANMCMIREADCGIVNLTPFRGPSADVGTVFELGVLTGLGKPCFAYSNDSDPLLTRLQRDRLAAFDEKTAR